MWKYFLRNHVKVLLVDLFLNLIVDGYFAMHHDVP